MSGKFGGGGTKCVLCAKTAYTAEQVSFELKIYHVECFRCTTCNKKTAPGKSELWQGKVYDRRCFTKNGFAHEKTATKKWTPKASSGGGSGKYGGGGVKCTICSATVYAGECVSYDKKPFHAKCLTCETCKKKITPANCASFESKYYCTKCFGAGGFSQKQTKSSWVQGSSTGTTTSSGKWGGGGTKCFVCTKLVYGGEQVSYEKHAYHAKCMRCTFVKDGKKCDKLLPKLSDAKLYEDNLYCKQCWERGGFNAKQAKVKWTPKTGGSTTGSSKFGGGGAKCASCAKTVYSAEAVSFEKHIYHPKCMSCADCNLKLKATNASMFEERLICKKCWASGGYKNKQMAAHKAAAESKAPTDARFNKFGGGGTKCDVCKKTVYTAELLSYEKHAFHAKCFTCQNNGCGTKLKVGKANYRKSGGAISIYCEKCYTSLGLNRAQLNDTSAGTEEAPEATEEAPEVTEAAPEEAPEEAPETPDVGDGGDRPELD